MKLLLGCWTDLSSIMRLLQDLVLVSHLHLFVNLAQQDYCFKRRAHPIVSPGEIARLRRAQDSVC